MIYSGKISELTKVLNSANAKAPEDSKYLFYQLERTFERLGLKKSFPKTQGGVIAGSILLPDGNPGNFVFDSDRFSLTISYTLITKDFDTSDRERFYPYLTAYFVHKNGDFEDFGKHVSFGYVYRDELKSPKAKFISAKARSTVLKVSKIKDSSKIEDYLNSF